MRYLDLEGSPVWECGTPTHRKQFLTRALLGVNNSGNVGSGRFGGLVIALGQANKMSTRKLEICGFWDELAAISGPWGPGGLEREEESFLGRSWRDGSGSGRQHHPGWVSLDHLHSPFAVPPLG